MDVAAFRAAFPEFASVTVYPDAGVSFWAGLAEKLLRAERWFDVLDQGVMLFVAHNLALERLAQSQAGTGGAPGLNGGIVSAKSVDKLSITYNTTIGVEPGAGHWGLTTYGTRFLWLANLAGMGPTQVGAGAAYGVPGAGFVYGGAFGMGWPYAA